MGKKKRTGGFEENNRDLFGDFGSLSGKDFETSDDTDDLFLDSYLDDEEDAESEEKATDKGMSDEDAAKHIAELLSGLFEAAGHADAKQKEDTSKAGDSDAEIDAMVSKAAAKVGKALKTAKRGAEVGKKGLETAAESVTESEAFKKLVDSVYHAMEVAKVGADKVKDAVKREENAGAEFDFEDFDTVRTESESLDSDNPLATLGFYELSKEGGASEVLNEALTALNEKYRGLSGTVIEEALLAALSADTESRLNGKVVETENRLLSYRVRSLERLSTELREAVSGCALTPNEYVELREKVDNLDKQIEGLREINAEFTRLGKKSR